MSLTIQKILKDFLVSNLPNEPLSLQSREVTDLDFNEILSKNLYTLFYFGNGLPQKKSFKTFEEMISFVNRNADYEIERIKLPKSADWLNTSVKK